MKVEERDKGDFKDDDESVSETTYVTKPIKHVISLSTYFIYVRLDLYIHASKLV